MEEEGKGPYQRKRRFLEGSKLHQFLSFKLPEEFSINRRAYPLFVVLAALKKMISQERLYDGSNTTCIMLNPELEWALGMKYLHVTEVRDVVLDQMESIGVPFPPQNVRTPPPSTFDIEGTYFPSKNFLKVLKKVESCPDRNVFTYRELCELLSKYILARQDKFFDNRNIKMADVSNDLLGIAFGVKIFHRTQVSTLLRSQLFPASSLILLRNGKALPKYVK